MYKYCKKVSGKGDIILSNKNLPPGHIFLGGNQSLPVLSKTPTNQIDGFCWSKLCGKRLDSLRKSFPSICDLEGVKSGKVCLKKLKSTQ